MERAGQALAATRAGRVAIAVERYRRRQGKLPASLTDLASPIPADPFTGHDLLYRRTEDGFVVASIGPARAADARARLTRGAGRRASASASPGLTDETAEGTWAGVPPAPASRLFGSER